MKDEKSIVVSRLTVTVVIVGFIFLVARLNDTQNSLAHTMTTRGLASVRMLQPDRKMMLESQFSGDPVSALKEASQAKDLRTITESEYQDLLKNALLVVTTNKAVTLPNGAMLTSASVKSQIAVGENSSFGSVSTSSVSSDEPTAVEGSISVDDGSVSVGTGEIISGGSEGDISTTYNMSPPSTTPDGIVTVSTDGTVTESGTAVDISSDSAMPMMNAISIKSGAVSATATSKATSYISYTNVHGEVVVIGFDSHNIPVFKSVFKK